MNTGEQVGEPGTVPSEKEDDCPMFVSFDKSDPRKTSDPDREAMREFLAKFASA